MENIEQENRELRKEVTALKVSMVNMTSLMEFLVAAHNHPPIIPPSTQPQQTTIASKVHQFPFLLL